MWLLIALWVGWCCLHSVLITATVKHWFANRGGIWLGLYRLGYVCFSLLTLLPLLGIDGSFLGPVTPLGGLAMLTGWLWLLVERRSAISKESSH